MNGVNTEGLSFARSLTLQSLSLAALDSSLYTREPPWYRCQKPSPEGEAKNRILAFSFGEKVPLGG